MKGDALRLANPPRGVILDMPTFEDARARIARIPLSAIVSWLADNRPDMATRVRSAVRGRSPPTDPRVAGEIVSCIDDLHHDDEVYDDLWTWLVRGVGLVAGLEALGHAGSQGGRSSRPVAGIVAFSAHWRAFGRLLSQAGDAEYADVCALAADWRSRYTDDALLHASIAMIFPSESWATDDALTATLERRGTDVLPNAMLLLANGDAGAAERIVRASTKSWDPTLATAYPAHALVYRFGAAAVPWLTVARDHAVESGRDGKWAKERIDDALQYVSGDLVAKLGRPRTVKASARVRVHGELRVAGDVAVWKGSSRDALEAWRVRRWKADERFVMTIGPERVVVDGELRGTTYLFEGEALARAFCVPPDAGIALTGEVEMIEPESGLGLRIVAAGVRGVRVERVTASK